MKSCDAPSVQPAPKSLQNGISTSFRHVFASPRPEIPLFSGKFCLNVPHSTHRGLPRNCSSKAHRGLALEPGLGLVSPPMMGNFATASRRESDLFPPTRSQGAQRDPLGPRSRNRPRPSGWELESQIRGPRPCAARPLVAQISSSDPHSTPSRRPHRRAVERSNQSSSGRI